MKKILLISLLSLFVFACNNTNKERTKSKVEGEKEQEVVVNSAVYSVGELLEKAPDMTDQIVTVKGTVMHVCKHSGARCFLMGSTEDTNIRIEAGDKIGAFTNEQMGSDLIVKGTLKYAEKEHEEEGKEKGEAADKLHKTGERVYFIEGIELIKE